MANEISLEGMSEQDRNNLAALAIRLSTGEKTRKDFQKLIKAENPSFSSPELELEDLRSQMTGSAEQAKRLEKLEGELAERNAREKWDSIKQEPVKAGLITAEEIPDLEAYMKEKGFNATQYRQAAEHRNMENQLAVPTAAALKPFQMNDDGLKLAKKDPKAFLRNNTISYLNEMRTRRTAA
jgi:hypothetical protein